MDFIDDSGVFYRYLYEHCHCVNAGQSPEERRLKYAIAKYFGKCAFDARIYRDFQRTTFAKSMGYGSWDSMLNLVKKEFIID